MSSQNINCNVSTCRHNDSQSKCSLSGILVGNSTPGAKNTHETECNSFECQ